MLIDLSKGELLLGIDMRRFIVFVVALFLLPVGAEAKALVWKTEATLGARVKLETCDPNIDTSCGDHVPYASASIHGVNYYTTIFMDGVMQSNGFGTVPNSALTLPLVTVHDGAFDWGGVEENGVFKPLYVIKRFYNNDETLQRLDTTALYIFRLMPDGTSCQIAMPETLLTVNEEARGWTEKDADAPTCLR
jgi:hypothetical protein